MTKEEFKTEYARALAKSDWPRALRAVDTRLDATQPVKISAVGRDAEGNAVDLSATELRLIAESTNDKNFGSINDANDTFDPGESGATGRITGTVTVGGIEYSATVEVELVPGGPVSLELQFAPSQA